MPLQAGENVGQYRIIEQLGQGGMATVYKAYHARLSRYVAIKMMHQAFLDDETFLTRFAREAQIVARLEHPHIVPVYDFDEYQGQPYLVMKFIEGHTLKRELASGTLTLKQILKIMTAVGQALTYAHEKGILHRDIKPSNIVIDQDNTAYLTDFGLARMAQAGESTLSQDMLLGTPHYISPEQATGQSDLDHRTDIYSLGVVLYELIVGRVPFNADTPYAVIHDHIYTPLPLPCIVNPEVPTEVETVLLKALAKDRNDRYQSASQMVEEFAQALANAGLTDLSPNRASIAAVSLAKMREERHNASVAEASSPPQRKAGVPAPIQTQPEADGITVNEQTPPQGRFWLILGIAVLLLTCFASISITSNAVKSIDGFSELATLDASRIVFTPESPPNVPPQRPDTPNIPSVSVETAQGVVSKSPSDPLAYLTLARAFWEGNRQQEAIDALAEGLQYADNAPQYLLTAGTLAAQTDRPAIAGAIALQALTRFENNADVYPAIREQSGAYLYLLALDAPVVERSDVFRNLAASDTSMAELPPVVAAITARALITQGALPRAEIYLQAVLRQTNLPEAHLILGELRSAQGDSESARAEWEQARQGADAPQWVRQRATELLDSTLGA